MNETWWTGEEQLDDDQKKIAALPMGGSHLIVGPPGSGKTNLLLLRAKYMALAGYENVQVLIFTRTLQEFISLGTDEYQLPENSVTTHRKWQHDLLRRYGSDFKPQGSFSEQRAELNKTIQDVIVDRNINDIYEAIILDEAQDYLPEEIEIFHHLSKSIVAAADSRQKIYNTAECLKTLRKVVEREHILRFHYRNGHKICRVADYVVGSSPNDSLLATSNYNEVARPSSVDLFKCADFDQQVKQTLEKLELQLKAYPDEMIGIICPNKEAVVNQIWPAISQSPFADLSTLQVFGSYGPFDLQKRICVSTLHSAKGLEFRTLHLLGCEHLEGWEYHVNMTFTAVTRAKTSLSIYYSRKIPGYLKQAISALNPPVGLPKVSQLFRKGKR